jgi:hypothetical protein
MCSIIFKQFTTVLRIQSPPYSCDSINGKGRKVYEEHNEVIRRTLSENGRPLLEFKAKQGWKP